MDQNKNLNLNPQNTQPNSETCQVKIGFIHPKSCNHSAVAHCEKCGVPVCENHKKVIGVNTFCPECAAQVLSQDQTYKNQYQQMPADLWYYGTRRRLYSYLGFTPFYYYGWGRPHYGSYGRASKDIDFFDS